MSNVRTDNTELIDVELEDGTFIEWEVPLGLSDAHIQSLIDQTNWNDLLIDHELNEMSQVKQVAEAQVSRGVRNNNPGNIRRSREKWEGLSKDQTDSEFFRFESPEMGLRAMVKVLQTYKNKHGIDTVDAVVNRWAPPSENLTHKYASFVASRMGIGLKDKIDLSDVNTVVPLIAAMTKMETGETYGEEVIREGARLAGLDLATAQEQSDTQGVGLGDPNFGP